MKKTTLALVFSLFSLLLCLGFGVYRLNTAQTEQPPKVVVVQVIGRLAVPFDGLGAETEFLVTDGQKFMIVRYDDVPVIDQKGGGPKFLTLTTLSNGEIFVASLMVEPFH